MTLSVIAELSHPLPSGQGNELKQIHNKLRNKSNKLKKKKNQPHSTCKLCVIFIWNTASEDEEMNLWHYVAPFVPYVAELNL